MNSLKSLSVFFILFAVLIFLSVEFSFGQTSVLWSENWEGNWTDNWHVDGGTWEVGVPTSGPDSAYSSSNCAATVLNGNYKEPVDSRLIRHTSFTVPPKSENPRLRFWHWYSFSHSDYGEVQIKVGNGVWEPITDHYTHTSSNSWTSPFIDLSTYSDSTVQIAFHFYSRDDGNHYGSDISSGWYIDDVEVVTGPVVFNNPESFETGMGDWGAEKGTWEVGAPSFGPGDSYSGNNCVGTQLAGNYKEPASTRFISPSFTIPSKSENPRLRFWHWYSFSHSDYGEVQIKVGNGAWEPITDHYTHTSSNSWTSPFIDLSTYSDSTVQIAFYFYSQDDNSHYGSDVSSGWYIDDIEVVTGPVVFNNPESFETGIGDWGAEKGTWEVGAPSSGPGDSYSGNNCVGTQLAGNYKEPASTRFISPSFTIPSKSENPRLRFWHWYSFSHSDYGEVQIKEENGNWEPISPQYTNTSSDAWTFSSLDLTDYSDSTVQIAFYFYSQDDNSHYGSDVSSGWYIDDVTFPIGVSPIIDSFLANPISGKVPLVVNFSCQAHDPDGSISKYHWNFGDGNSTETTTSTEKNIYTEAGTFYANCTVFDNSGDSTISKQIPITIIPKDTLFIYIPNYSTQAGATISIPIKIENALGLAGVECKVTYDTSFLTAQKVDKATLTSGFILEDSLSAGKIAISLANDSGLTVANGDLVNLTFQVNDNPQGDSTKITLEKVALYDANTDSMAFEKRDGMLYIHPSDTIEKIIIIPETVILGLDESNQFKSKGITAVNKDTVTVVVNWRLTVDSVGTISNASDSVTIFLAKKYGSTNLNAEYVEDATKKATAIVHVGLFGDITGDNIIDSRDAIRCLQIIVGTYTPNEYQRWAADFNQDGVIDEGDAKEMLNISLGRLISKYLAVANEQPAIVKTAYSKTCTQNEILFSVLVENRRDVEAAGLEFTYDENLLTTQEIKSTCSNVFMVTNTKIPGKIRVSIINAEPLVNSQGTLLTVKFRAKGDLPATFPVSLATIRLYGAAAEKINVEFTHEITDQNIIPESFALLQNTPNPFNPDTEIRYRIPKASYVKLVIYNMKGQLVRTLIDKQKEAGEWKTIWNGKDELGRNLPSGVYIYRIQAGSFTDSKKMLFVK